MRRYGFFRVGHGVAGAIAGLFLLLLAGGATGGEGFGQDGGQAGDLGGAGAEDQGRPIFPRYSGERARRQAAAARRAARNRARRTGRRAARGILDWRSPSGRPPAGETRYRPDEVIVEYRAGTSARRIAAIAATVGLTELSRLSSALRDRDIIRYRITRKISPDEAIRRLERDPRVAFAQPNYLYVLVGDGAAAGSSEGPQYAFGRLHLGEAHKRATGRDVRIAVIDSGIDRSHADLRNASIEELDAVEAGEAEANDDRRHGTAIAGILVANGTVRGAAPDARILAIRAFARQGGTLGGDGFSIARALELAIANRARIVNMSFQGPPDPALRRLITAASRRGTIFVAAAGNGGRDAAPAYPAAYRGVIAVTATDASDRLYDNANRGAYVDLAAPGVDVLTLAPGNGYDVVSGTSIASAHLSAVIALILQNRPNLGGEEVAALLADIATDLGPPGRDDAFGAGLPDALAAVLRD